ncbi:AlpA family phage regulatory protein [Rhizobium sp. WL3]|nr:AlpA family phage regulatory protein [Rhizobium sp. WL3]
MRVLLFNELRKKGIPFTKTHLWRLARDGNFPKPMKLGNRTNAWSEEDIDAWLKEQHQKRDRGAA